MMTIRRAALTVASIAALLGPPASAALKVRYYKGQPTYVSLQHSSVIEVAVPEQVRNKQIPIGVVAMNGSARPVSLGYENVSVRTTHGEPVKLVTYEDLQHQARVRAGWATFFTVLAAGANGYLAERNAYGHVGRYSYYSPVAAQIGLDRASAQSAEMMGQIEQGLAEQMAQLDGQVLRTTTVDPGRLEGGTVYVELPRNTTIRDLIVTIAFAGDSHDIPLGDPTALDQASAADVALTSAPPPPIPAPREPEAAAYVTAAEPAVVPEQAVVPAEPAVVSLAVPRSARKRCAVFSSTNPEAVTCRVLSPSP
jgi:hypothetical protein